MPSVALQRGGSQNRKKCVIRKRRCLTHRMDLIEVKDGQTQMSKGEDGLLKYERVPKFICGHRFQLVREKSGADLQG